MGKRFLSGDFKFRKNMNFLGYYFFRNEEFHLHVFE